MGWKNEWVFRRCTCPPEHYVAGVCPKLTFLAQWRNDTIDEVAKRVSEYNGKLPVCTGGDDVDVRMLYDSEKEKAVMILENGNPCTCALHYRARAVCPRRNAFLVDPRRDGRYGGKCRTDNYSTGAYPYGLTDAAAVLARDFLAMITGAAAWRLFTSEHARVAREVHDRMLAGTNVTWSAPARDASLVTPLLPNEPARVDGKLYAVQELHHGTGQYTLSDGSGIVVAFDADVEAVATRVGSVVTSAVQTLGGRQKDKPPALVRTGVVLDYAWSHGNGGLQFKPLVYQTSGPEMEPFVGDVTNLRNVDVGGHTYTICDQGVVQADGTVRTWGDFPLASVTAHVVAARGARGMYHTASEEIGADVALAILFSTEPDEALRKGRIERLRFLAECAASVPLAKADIGSTLLARATTATGERARALAVQIITYLCVKVRQSDALKAPFAGVVIYSDEAKVRRNCDVLALRARRSDESGNMPSLSKVPSAKNEQLFQGEGTIWNTEAVAAMCKFLSGTLQISESVCDFAKWNDALNGLRRLHATQNVDITETQRELDARVAAEDLEAKIGEDLEAMIGALAAGSEPREQSFGGPDDAKLVFLAVVCAHALRDVAARPETRDTDEIYAEVDEDGLEEEKDLLVDNLANNLAKFDQGGRQMMTARARNRRRITLLRAAAEGARERNKHNAVIARDASLCLDALAHAERVFVKLLAIRTSYAVFAKARAEPQNARAVFSDKLAARMKTKNSFGVGPTFSPPEELVKAALIVAEHVRTGNTDGCAEVAGVSPELARVMKCGLYDALVAACAKRNSRPRAMKFV